MLSVFANAMTLATRQDGWSDPSRHKTQSDIQKEREEVERQPRFIRKVGMR